MLTASHLGATTAPVLHDTPRVRSNFKCSGDICYGVGPIDPERPSLGKMHDWFVATQVGINAIGAQYIPSWVRIKEDGLLGASTVAAAKKVFPLVPSLLIGGFHSPGSKEQLALWIRGLSFPTGGMFLHQQLREFAALKAPVATAPAPSRPFVGPCPVGTVKTVTGCQATAPCRGTMSNGVCLPIKTQPPTTQTAPAPHPVGPTSGTRPQGTGTSPDTVAPPPTMVAFDPSPKKTDSAMKGLLIVGGLLVAGFVGYSVLTKKA